MNSSSLLSQWQFGITTVYHFFFVPLTLGLSILVAILETMYVRTKNEDYKKLTKFFGTLFLINFALGVVTGIVQEFQFGMNWADYSRYVGDIFGAPLAIEALLAFFLESTFLGIWMFGWDKLSKNLHLAAIWLVAFGANLSAFWILVANSFMQHPVGYAEEGGRLVLNSFSALLTNPYVWGQFPHTIFAGLTTAACFMLGISAYHMYRKNQPNLFKKTFVLSTVVGIISVTLLGLVGHTQAQKMVQMQPMKIAASEALVETEDPAAFSVFTIVDQKTLDKKVDIRLPKALSLLAFNKLSGEVKGINELSAAMEAEHGPGNYVPNIFVTYWSFRIMAGLGTLIALIFLVALFRYYKKKLDVPFKWNWIFGLGILIPYLANTTGWLLTEMGRQPWIVYGKLKTVDAVSPSITPGMVLASLIGFTLLYGVLMVVDVSLLNKYAKAGIPEASEEPATESTDEKYWS